MRKAVLALPVRNGKTFPVPSGSISLLIRHRKSGVSETVRLNWAVTGEPIDELPARAPFSMPPVDYDLLTIEDSFPKAEESYRCAGYSRISIPAGATVLRKEPFVAYYYPSAKGNVGYLRIGDYFPKNSEGGSEYEERFRQYEQVVSVFQKETVGLIIDQDHNCGGSVDFMHKFMSLFMGSSFKPLQFSLLASKEQYVLYRNWMYTVPEGTAKRRNLETVFDLIKESWETGAPMTQLTAIDGMPEIASNPVHYTKPIIILIDEFAGSGGDAFPALMKGYGRAKLLGSRTMGAGGHVREFPPLYYSQIGLRLTKSLFYRPDGIPVENNGAIPDFNYAITLDDFVSGYRAYRNFYTDRLNELF
ncbi:MAG TPA: hypothetical protein DCS07_00220 [Bdellovibrionales bacterium]|nr:MAG: hypothetical protein A2070_09185 [Bdellovibrionales bacterium GWC1_52_8]HAR41057.1 hypothetical protein [Bdellovibrionales bacterium]